jgi:hypothetical protein
MRYERDWKILKDELDKKLREKPGLSKSPGEVVKAETEMMLQEVDQRLKRVSAP